MNEEKDNKLENIFFEMILNNHNLNIEILKIYDLIKSQNIWKNDKIIINKKIFWLWLINEDEEIKELLKSIRNDDIKEYLLYKMVFEIIEDIFDIDDTNHLNILLSNLKEELETDIIYFLKDIFKFLYEKIRSNLEAKKWFLWNIDSDYLDNKELSELLNEIEKLFKDITIELKKSEEKRLIKEKIKKEMERKNEILNIK